MSIFALNMAAISVVEGRNSALQTFLDFEKTKALLDLSMLFSKIAYNRGYLGIIFKNWVFGDTRANLDRYRNPVLSAIIQAIILPNTCQG